MDIPIGLLTSIEIPNFCFAERVWVVLNGSLLVKSFHKYFKQLELKDFFYIYVLNLQDMCFAFVTILPNKYWEWGLKISNTYHIYYISYRTISTVFSYDVRE